MSNAELNSLKGIVWEQKAKIDILEKENSDDIKLKQIELAT